MPETLIPAFERLEAGMREHLHSAEFKAAVAHELKTFVGRPTALTFVPRISERWGAQIYLKREDLAHTGAHKINNAIGQALLAKRIGAKRVIAETGAGQHGVASAAACARVGLPCTVYMGEVDMERQAPNVGRMRLLGAKVVPVTSGDRTLRAAIDEAMRDWVGDPLGTYYLFGSATGPHPYPYLVRELQSIIGREARAQMLEQAAACRMRSSPASAAARTRSASSIRSSATRRCRSSASKRAAAAPASATTPRRSCTAAPACCTAATRCCSRMRTVRSRKRIPSPRASTIPASAPSTRCCSPSGRIEAPNPPADDEALACVKELCELEGILPAHRKRARARAARSVTPRRNPGKRILVGLSGRGDKDMPTLQKTLLATGQP